MAGTDRKSRATAMDSRWPVILLLRPQLGENIGMVARAMLNMGLTELRLVNPREGWPNEAAIKPSSGALPDAVRVDVFGSLADAAKDLHKLWATTARPRDMTMAVQTPHAAITEVHSLIQQGQKVGLMFGREATGMSNDEIVFADKIITVPLNSGFSSLNLAQAVLLMAWEWRKANDNTKDEVINYGEDVLMATKKDLQRLFDHLEFELDQAGFFKTAEKKPIIARNLRNIFERAELSQNEVRALRGMVAALTRRHEIPKEKR